MSRSTAGLRRGILFIFAAGFLALGFLRRASAQTSPPADGAPHQLSDVTIEGTGFEIAPLQDGELTYSNHVYVWENIPDQVSGWQFTRIAASNSTQFTVTAKRDLTLYAGVMDPHHRQKLDGWTKVPEITFNDNDKSETAAVVYKRDVAAGGVVKFVHLTDSAMFAIIPVDAPAENPKGADAQAAGATQPVWLAPGEHHSADKEFGLMAWELCRQSVLIAARDELGMQTRDQSLREWGDAPPADKMLAVAADENEISLARGGTSAPIWKLQFDVLQWSIDTPRLAENAEKWSRSQIPAALRAAGYAGKAEAIKTDLPVPDDVEKNLSRLDELSQFTAVRLIHTAMKTGGQSPQLLGALARGYANLSQLTRYHWSAESAVYGARAMLYAQRMAALYPRVADSFRTRAYVKAMLGFPAAALDDLKSAEKQKNPPPQEDWAALIEPLCHYQTAELLAAAKSNPQQAPLALFLAWLTAEHSDCPAMTMNVAQAAFDANPLAVRLIDGMCGLTGPGKLNELVPQEDQVISRMLGGELTGVPGLPKTVTDAINNARRPGGNPTGRNDVCRQLISAGMVAGDSGEPSYAALGRMIQEETFAQVRRQADLIARKWGVDASDYVQKSLPLVADHPYRGVIEVYGVALERSPDLPQKMAKLIADAPMGQITYIARDVFDMEGQAQSHGPGSAMRIYAAIFCNSDLDGWDLENLILWSGLTPDSPRRSDTEGFIKTIAPDSPVSMAVEIRENWLDSSAAKWEEAAPDHPTVALALARRYNQLKQYDEANKWLKAYLAVSPDMMGFELLAKNYKAQGNDEQWLATLRGLLDQPSLGLEHAEIQTQIAYYYMGNGDFASALPYADAAGQTAAAWGLEAMADAHAGTGDWSGAQETIRGIITHYSLSPSMWYFWCVRTGHGDCAAALAASRDYFRRQGTNLTDADLSAQASIDMLEGRGDLALRDYRRELDAHPGAITALHVALLAGDKQRDLRDVMLGAATSYASTAAPAADFAKLLKTAVASHSPLSDEAMDDILKRAADSDQNSICYLAGTYLNELGRQAAAEKYWRRGVTAMSPDDHSNPDAQLMEAALRKRGVDTWKLEHTAATRPAQ